MGKRLIIPVILISFVIMSQDLPALERDQEAHFRLLREAMVKEQISNPPDYRHPVKDQRVLDAMRTVPRHLFVQSDDISRAYGGSPPPHWIRSNHLTTLYCGPHDRTDRTET